MTFVEENFFFIVDNSFCNHSYKLKHIPHCANKKNIYFIFEWNMKGIHAFKYSFKYIIFELEITFWHATTFLFSKEFSAIFPDFKK